MFPKFQRAVRHIGKRARHKDDGACGKRLMQTEKRFRILEGQEIDVGIVEAFHMGECGFKRVELRRDAVDLAMTKSTSCPGETVPTPQDPVKVTSAGIFARSASKRLRNT